MIRFVPIEAKLDVIHETDCFAFFDTVTEKFIELSGCHVFVNKEDLYDAWLLESAKKLPINRLNALL